MKVISIAGPKGGVGKTLTTCSLSVRAAEDTGRVAILDMDEGQGTLTEWWTLRGRPVNPYLYNTEGTLDDLIGNLRADGWTYCFIDGPPHDHDLIEMSVIVSDAVIVPVKLSYFDTSAIDSIKSMCERHKKPFAFVLNEFDDRKVFATANQIGLSSLKGRGTILPTRVSYDPKYRVGQMQGKTGAEVDTKTSAKGNVTKGPIAQEIDSLWNDVLKLAGIPAKGGRNV
jgi:chromosome partitioning protein